MFHEYGGVEELYDREADPNELMNLAGKQEHENVRMEMNRLLLGSSDMAAHIGTRRTENKGIATFH